MSDASDDPPVPPWPRLAPHRLHALPAAVEQPRYDRAALRPGLLHLGLGAFHRAHQAIYTERLLARGDLRWGIVGVQLRGVALAAALAAQRGLYAVSEVGGAAGDEVRIGVVGALLQAAGGAAGRQRAIQALADPSLAAVTITVTEKGYGRDAASGALDTADPDVRHDLAHPDAPQTLLGVLAAGLRRRPPASPLTLLSCDNLAHNGHTLQALLRQFADAAAPALQPRLDDEFSFPDTMVDRIVPAATPASLAEAAARLRHHDAAAVACEPFSQWVIEDRFAGPRPPWHKVGATLTDDVAPWQAMKLRLLNGTHSALAAAGLLAGQPTIAAAIADPLLGRFAAALMDEDLCATLQPPAGFDLPAYAAVLRQRFANPALGHRCAQVGSDGTQKLPLRWLPALREAAAAGAERPWLERALVIWLHGLAHPPLGAPAVEDPGAAPLVARLRAATGEAAFVQAALAHAPVFGSAPWPPAFEHRLAGHLHTLRAGGLPALLAAAAGR